MHLYNNTFIAKVLSSSSITLPELQSLPSPPENSYPLDTNGGDVCITSVIIKVCLSVCVPAREQLFPGHIQRQRWPMLCICYIIKVFVCMYECPQKRTSVPLTRIEAICAFIYNCKGVSVCVCECFSPSAVIQFEVHQEIKNEF